MVTLPIVVRVVNMRLIPVRSFFLCDLLEWFAHAPRAGLDSRINGALQTMHALAQSGDRRYNGQRPFPEAVKELPSILALFLMLLFATRGRLTIVIHAGASWGKNKGHKVNEISVYNSNYYAPFPRPNGIRGSGLQPSQLRTGV
jgi:hypothetical protein